MQDWNDRDLETLFREMRRHDREAATPFREDWELARSRIRTAHKTPLKYAFVIASIAAAAIIVVVVARLAWGPSPRPQQSAQSRDLSAPIQDLVDRHPGVTNETPAVPEPRLPFDGRRFVSGRVAPIKRTRADNSGRRSKPGTDPYKRQQLISTWRSPTDFLLKSAGADLLRTVPNMEDSVVRIDRR
jgi:hypothetical protein